MAAMRGLVWGMLRTFEFEASGGQREVNVGDHWGLYGVSKAGCDNKEGCEDLRRIEAYECGVCHVTFKKDVYADLNAFYHGHYVHCGEPIDWGWE